MLLPVMPIALQAMYQCACMCRSPPHSNNSRQICRLDLRSSGLRFIGKTKTICAGAIFAFIRCSRRCSQNQKKLSQWSASKQMLNLDSHVDAAKNQKNKKTMLSGHSETSFPFLGMSKNVVEKIKAMPSLQSKSKKNSANSHSRTWGLRRSAG